MSDINNLVKNAWAWDLFIFAEKLKLDPKAPSTEAQFRLFQSLADTWKKLDLHVQQGVMRQDAMETPSLPLYSLEEASPGYARFSLLDRPPFALRGDEVDTIVATFRHLQQTSHTRADDYMAGVVSGATLTAEK